MSGSACVNLAMVAAGKVDAYIEDGYGGVWDVAAGKILVEEAGGVVVGLEGEEWELKVGEGRVVAGNREVVGDVVRKVGEADLRYGWRERGRRGGIVLGVGLLLGGVGWMGGGWGRGERGVVAVLR